MDAAATYAGSFLLYPVLVQEGFQECERLGENCLLIIVAVQQEVVDLCSNRGAGVIQIVCQEIVSGNIKGVGNEDNQLKAELYLPRFDSTDVFVIYIDYPAEFFLRYLLACPSCFDALTYA